jgi:hypothetical protein
MADWGSSLESRVLSPESAGAVVTNPKTAQINAATTGLGVEKARPQNRNGLRKRALARSRLMSAQMPFAPVVLWAMPVA